MIHWIKPHCYHKWNRIDLWWGNIIQLLHWFKNFFIRGAQGWCEEDSWSMDDYIVDIILPMLVHLKNNSIGYPISETEQSWHECLDKMILGFVAIKNLRDFAYCDTGGKVDVNRYSKLVSEFDNGMELFHKHFSDLWN